MRHLSARFHQPNILCIAGAVDHERMTPEHAKSVALVIAKSIHHLHEKVLVSPSPFSQLSFGSNADVFFLSYSPSPFRRASSMRT